MHTATRPSALHDFLRPLHKSASLFEVLQAAMVREGYPLSNQVGIDTVAQGYIGH